MVEKNKMRPKFKCGIEIHVTLETCKSKLFCSCPTSGSEEPNTRTCEQCLGLPGSKPVLNIEALKQAIKVALALNCKISQETFFSRKSYFYPDMNKNYQITQYEIPIANSGILEGIRIRRIHLEEDPGALIHKNNFTLIDYNRAGNSLIEIVTEPDFKSPNEVRKFIRKLTTILEYLNVYTRKSEATMKADVNISTTGERVEIKNITGLKEIERALDYEILRQEKEIPKVQETRSWDAKKGITFLTRLKETEEDYGYITDSDLVKIEISKELISELKSQIPELSLNKIQRFQRQYQLEKEDAEVLSSEIKLSELFEQVASKISPKLAAKWLRRDLQKILKANKTSLKEVNLDAKHIIELLSLFEQNKITDHTAKKILKLLITKQFSPLEYIKKEKLEIISSIEDIETLCKEAINENKAAVEDYKKGNEKAINFIIGALMRKTKGKADPKKLEKILKSLIK